MDGEIKLAARMPWPPPSVNEQLYYEFKRRNDERVRLYQIIKTFTTFILVQ